MKPQKTKLVDMGGWFKCVADSNTPAPTLENINALNKFLAERKQKKSVSIYESEAFKSALREEMKK